MHLYRVDRLSVFVCILAHGISMQLVSGNKLIEKYEELTSDRISYTFNSRHSRRSAMYTASADHLDDDLVIRLVLSGNPYSLLLTKVQPPVRRHNNVTVNGKRVDVDRFYSGFVSGLASKSSVSGFINSKGNFEGHVTIRNVTWILESTEVIFGKDLDEDVKERSPTVAFKETDLSPVNFNGLCGNSGGEKRLPQDFKFDRPQRDTVTSAPSHNTCEILVVVDHKFSKAYNDNFNDITHAVSYFVKEADNIFENTVFDGKKGYAITIGRFEIFTEDRVNDDDYPFKNLGENVGSGDFLRALSEKSRNTRDWNSDYCLVFAFTDRDFDNVLGEAYTGGTYGGICKLYRQGVVTMKLQGERRSKLLVSLTFAHEAGHSYGASHDSDGACMPGGTEGNYLMHPSSQPGSYDNNILFSPCSREEIGRHLEESGSSACFVQPKGEFCGNNVVEGDEDCDCGFADPDGKCYDKCCQPAFAEFKATQCKLNGNARCSPTADDCCSTDCQPLGSNVPCGQSDECAVPRSCPGGTNSKCPEKQNRDNGQLCSNGSKSCVDGNCVGSACLSLGTNYEQCSCDADEIENSKEVNCVVCCREANPGAGICQPINVIAPEQWADTLHIGEGDICSSNDGYCDVYHRCRSFVEEGALLKLISQLFNADKWSDFALQYWWAIILVAISLIIIVSVFVHFTAIYTPTQNPNVKQYQGPKSYMTKRYAGMRESRSRKSEYDASDAANQNETEKERRSRMARMTNQKRHVVVPSGVDRQASRS